ncbi:unnamed protein product [Phytophthora fragariaefolia]|uniref:Unnamed protein product n=1 Tax=Phytophthora fragariaefolia TaxID=1490495 RepID=A0A9W6YBG5_9STRA|nr:unnamed protein product [Phytophthora fragariaefolia]
MRIDRRDVDASARELILTDTTTGIMVRHDRSDIGLNDASDASMRSQIIRRDRAALIDRNWSTHGGHDSHDTLNRHQRYDRRDRHGRHDRYEGLISTIDTVDTAGMTDTKDIIGTVDTIDTIVTI